MIRNTFFALLSVLAIASLSQAAVIVTVDQGAPTPGLAGYKTYIATATSQVEGELIAVIDFIGDAAKSDPNDPEVKGFFGAMNHIRPINMDTVFNNLNGFFAPSDPLADSQFRYSTSAADAVNSPAGFFMESPTSLRALFGRDVPLGQSTQFAQIVVPDAATGTVNFKGSFSVTQGGTIVEGGSAAGCIGVCGGVPVLPTVGNLSLVANDLNEVVSDTVALTDVATLAFDNINTPAFVPLIPLKPLELGQLPTLDNAGNFSWNTAGSKRGLYTWSITGTNPDGSDGGMISVEVTQIPEPATLSLFGLALVGFIGCARKRS